jgi:hypothetical protein
MRALLWVGTVAGLVAWIVIVQRRLWAAQQRGDMYRDAALRLDRRLAGLGEQER